MTPYQLNIKMNTWMQSSYTDIKTAILHKKVVVFFKANTWVTFWMQDFTDNDT